MAMIPIFVDSTSDLSPALLERYQLQVIPLNVHLNGQSYQDGIDLTPEQLFTLIEANGVLPTTSAPTIGDFVQAFSDHTEGIFIGISSQLSGTVNNARLAAESLPENHIRVIDSLTLSSAIGLLALKAADWRNSGASAAEIQTAVEAARANVRMSFALETMKYLQMGGRCTALQSLAAGMLKIRPIIAGMPDGTLGLKAKIRGHRAHALEALLQDFEQALPNVDLRRVFVTHAAAAEDATYLADQLAALAPVQEIHITTAGAVISSHCGPGTVGILYLMQ
ncbi:MAG TPA: DegV family protein [Anaerolineae bacterium]|nr:DegV family protein [Anaerolineae bacterium]HQH38324.1 DegV family protein [Anaerolineae bacterium]